MMTFHTISIIGLGYIGLPTAAMFASHKKKVIGVDINQDIVNTINQGKVHIVEPQLETLVRGCVTEGYLKATTRPEASDVFLIAVPTPFKDNHEPDLSYIAAACQAIAPVIAKGNLIILESTSPVGTTERIAAWLKEARPDLSFPQTHGEDSDIRICYCPERVLPGHSVRELVENDRIIGGLTPRCSQLAVSLYKTFVQGECLITNARTAEMTKLVENSFRDVNIAFANELSMICEPLNINVWELITLANRHPRVNILQPGPGVGGHCIAVDPWFIISESPKESRLIRMAREVNESKPQWVINKVKCKIADFLQAHPEKKISDIKIACLGLAFKADIDDLRESPALDITLKLGQIYPHQVSAVEPKITQAPQALLTQHISLVSLDEALGADIFVILVDHREFKECDHLYLVKKNMVDTKGLWL